MKTLIYLLALSVLLAGCNKLDNSPMGKLKSDKKYPELAKFWHEENKKKSDLWNQAITYCEQHKEKPNCSDVNYIKAMSHSYKTITGKLDANPINDSFDFK